VITADVTIARLLESHPKLIDTLADYHPHFQRLRDPAIRRVFAPRVTVEQAARMAGIVPAVLLAELRRAVGDGARWGATDGDAPPVDAAPATTPRPDELSGLPASRVRMVDVREDVRRGEEPFATIMAAVRTLGPDQVLVVRAPFEPIPLYDVLARRGFAHWTESHAPDDWAAWFYRQASGTAAQARPTASRKLGSDAPQVIDVRGLEPPQPMVRVLEALDRLDPGARLEVLHDRRPVFLYPQLDDRGFAHETDEPEPGLVRIVIRRPS
jgi:uncharacterized protein (DUF2249 family)